MSPTYLNVSLFLHESLLVFCLRLGKCHMGKYGNQCLDSELSQSVAMAPKVIIVN